MDGRLIFLHHAGRLSRAGRRPQRDQPASRGCPPGVKPGGEGVYDSEVAGGTAEKSRPGTSGVTVLKPSRAGNLDQYERNIEMV
jgi:hypothetical protein